MDTSATSTFKEELRKMIVSADQSVHDISKYKIKYSTMSTVLAQLIEKECYIEDNAYGAVRLDATVENNIVKTVKLVGNFNGFFFRVDKLKETMDKIRIGIDKDMSDLEKALYVHDYIVENTVYKNDNLFSFYACGPLVYGYGVCSGYSNAFLFVMTLLGVKTSYIVSNAMNHKWSYIYLDDAWYHIDLTWDDTQSQIENEISHSYFVRNDKEFMNSGTKKHYNWYNPTELASTSEKYTNLFVHDVIGKLYYQSGYWYYYDLMLNSVVRNNIDGTDYKIILDGHELSEKIKIISVNRTQVNCLLNDESIVIGI